MKLKIGDFLKRRKDAVDVTDGVKYKRATIRINHKGISIRDELDGTQIKTKRQFIISKGQFLLSKIDARNGAFGIVPEELNKGIITGNFWTFDVDQSKVLIDFFKSFTETVSFTDICIRSSSGTTNRKYLDEKKFLDIDIEVPNIEEQAVAISNYYQRREFINSLQSSGVNQRETLANLRQSILQEAGQGKLTENWRTENSNTEPASELLERIEAEKQKLIAEKKIKKEKPLSAVGEDEMPYELPKGWVWCRWVDLLGAVNYPMKRGPFGSSLRKADFVKNGIRVFEQYNPINDDPGWMRYFITESKYESMKAFTSEAGDFLISCSGATLGRIVYLPEGTVPGIINQALLKLTLSHEVIKPEYFLKLFRSQYIQKIIWENAKGMAQPNMVGVKELKQILIALPPMDEQIAISQKVDSLMALCDELEQQIETSQTEIEQLMQSCLKEVFEHESN